MLLFVVALIHLELYLLFERIVFTKITKQYPEVEFVRRV